MGFEIIVATIFVVLAAIGIHDQRTFIYRCGDTLLPYGPESFGLPTPSFRYQSPHYMYFARDGASRTVIFVAGNGASVQNSYWHLGRLYGVCNCNIIAIEKGCVSQTEMVNRVRDNMARFLLDPERRIDLHPYYLMGVSLGSAVMMQVYGAMSLGERRRIAGIILDNPFTTLHEVINHHLHKYLLYVPSWLVLDKWDNRAVVLDKPVLFLTAEKDEIVPPRMSLELMQQDNFTNNFKQVVLSGSLHGHAAAHPDYLPAFMH
jgi:pimeloyl-ACP methyl ester carboxylesterase